jgi:hypothetical protein
MLDEEPDDRAFTLLNVTFVVLLVLLLWNWTGYELVPGVVTYTIGPCDLDWHSGRPALAVACVGRDMIEVWPLPVEQPWWEDTIEMSDGELARRA